jgi:hypothetical protein
MESPVCTAEWVARWSICILKPRVWYVLCGLGKEHFEMEWWYIFGFWGDCKDSDNFYKKMS